MGHFISPLIVGILVHTLVSCACQDFTSRNRIRCACYHCDACLTPRRWCIPIDLAHAAACSNILGDILHVVLASLSVLSKVRTVRRWILCRLSSRTAKEKSIIITWIERHKALVKTNDTERIVRILNYIVEAFLVAERSVLEA